MSKQEQRRKDNKKYAATDKGKAAQARAMKKYWAKKAKERNDEK